MTEELIAQLKEFTKREDFGALFVLAQPEKERILVAEGQVMGALCILGIEDEEFRKMIIDLGAILSNEDKVKECQELLKSEE